MITGWYRCLVQLTRTRVFSRIQVFWIRMDITFKRSTCCNWIPIESRDYGSSWSISSMIDCRKIQVSILKRKGKLLSCQFLIHIIHNLFFLD